MKVVFYNVENLFDTSDDPKTRDDDFTPHGAYEWDDQRYYEKIEKIAEVLTAVGDGSFPAFIGLVEVENYKVVEDLISHRDFDHIPYKIIHAESRDQRGIDNALIYNEALFEAHEWRWLSIDAHAESDLFSRDILHVRGRLKNGPEMHIFVNHWPSRRAGQAETAHKRRAAALTLREAIDAIREKDPHAKILAMGDFNDTPADEGLKTIVQAGRDSKGPGELVNLGWQAHDRHKGTVRRDNEWHMFDQFVVSHDMLKNIRGKHMHIFDEDFVLFFGDNHEAQPNRTYVGTRYTGGYSDHLPIWLELDFELTYD
jgi:endonuclease/exonuclease/phosphatase family metal-dependent hydrolase